MIVSVGNLLSHQNHVQVLDYVVSYSFTLNCCVFIVITVKNLSIFLLYLYLYSSFTFLTLFTFVKEPRI